MAREEALEKTIQTRPSNALDIGALVDPIKIEGGVGLVILSWRGENTLRQSLESYRQESLFDLFNEAVAFLPDPTIDLIVLCENNNLRVQTSPTNLGILENMAEAASRLSTKYILMLENDCPLIATQSACRAQMVKSLALLSSKTAIMARLRSRTFPGQAFDGLEKYRRYFGSGLMPKLRRVLRPGKAKRLAGYAIYNADTTDLPTGITRQNDTFLVDASIMPWTNQSILIEREFFLDTIIPFARQVKSRRGANGFRNLEIELNNSAFWRNSGWKIACPPGLFTHERIGDRGYA